MAAPRKYPPPHEQLLWLAKAALKRSEPFDFFWLEAVRPGQPAITWATAPADRPFGCVVWPRDTFDRNNCIAATVDENVREGWRRAYEGAPPTVQEAALIRIGPSISRIIEVSAEIEALPTADEPVPASQRALAA